MDAAAEDEKMTETKISIGGMHCASCALNIERKLKKTKGVKDANVNFSIERASVDFDPKEVDEKKLVETIRGAGYQASVLGKNKDEEQLARARELEYFRNMTIISALFAVPVFAISMLMLPVPYAPYVLWILSTPVQFYVGYHFYKGAFSSLKDLNADMDTLIALGTSAAYFYSVYLVLVHGGMETYFETSAILITLVMLGKYLETAAKGRASQAIRRLLELSPKQARIIEDGKEIMVDAEAVKKGNVILVKPGERIPVDGVVIEGHSSVDESMISGEPIPIEKSAKSKVIGGTINKNGVLTFRATRVGSETTLSQIIQLVEDAQAKKAPIQRYADKVSSVFVPAVILIAVVTFVGWYAVLGEELSFSLILAVSVLVIACPCALGLATPTAIMVGTGRGASSGILIRNGAVLEKANAIDAIAFDKTGTITVGKPEIVSMLGKKEDIDIAYMLEKSSEHPLAESFVQFAKKKGIKENGKVSAFAAVPGKGIKGTVKGKKCALGSARLMDGITIPNETLEWKKKMEEKGSTVVLLAVGKKVTAAFAVADRIRDGSREAIAKLKRMGIKTYMITGDNARVAAAISKEAGIDKFYAEVLPDEKANIVKQIAKSGLNVGMVGDGINDAPALAVSDLGIAMGSGTDVAIETGDIILMRNSLLDVPKAISLSKATMGKIRQNLFWALIYNVVGIPVAAGVLFPFFGILLSPMLAGGAMALSSVSVVTNSLLLNKSRL